MLDRFARPSTQACTGSVAVVAFTVMVIRPAVGAMVGADEFTPGRGVSGCRDGAC